MVYSATPGGIAAAIAASRGGARVLLVEPGGHVGGLSTSGLNTAESEHMLKWTIGGLAGEFYNHVGGFYGLEGPEYYFESLVAERIYLKMLEEAGVEMRFNASLLEVETAGGRIHSLTLRDGTVLTASVFVDAGYEGDLLAAAGCAYAVGREARSEFQEEAAGIRLDPVSREAQTVDEHGELLPGISGWTHSYREGDAHPGVMNYNFRLTVTRNPDLLHPFPLPDRYDAKRFQVLKNWFRAAHEAGREVCLRDILDFYKRAHDHYEMNNKQSAIFSLGHFGGQFRWPEADEAGRREIYADHMDYTLGLIHFLSSDGAVPESVRTEMRDWGLHKGEFRDNGHLPYQLYVREGRRLRGETVVTQRDVQNDRRKPDSIGICSHFIDCHHVQRLAISPTAFVNEGRIWRMGYAYQIPYRALTPKRAECANLLVPVAAGFSHVAFCSFRLESVWMIAGHAAGAAAAMAAGSGQAVQDVNVRELQDRLREQGQVVDFLAGAPEKCGHLNGPPEF